MFMKTVTLIVLYFTDTEIVLSFVDIYSLVSMLEENVTNIFFLRDTRLSLKSLTNVIT